MATHLSIGDILRNAMKRDGRSLYSLAKTTGIDRSQLVRFANGDRGLNLDTAGALVKALGLALRPARKRSKR